MHDNISERDWENQHNDQKIEEIDPLLRLIHNSFKNNIELIYFYANLMSKKDDFKSKEIKEIHQVFSKCNGIQFQFKSVQKSMNLMVFSQIEEISCLRRLLLRVIEKLNQKFQICSLHQKILPKTSIEHLTQLEKHAQRLLTHFSQYQNLEEVMQILKIIIVENKQLQCQISKNLVDQSYVASPQQLKQIFPTINNSSQSNDATTSKIEQDHVESFIPFSRTPLRKNSQLKHINLFKHRRQSLKNNKKDKQNLYPYPMEIMAELSKFIEEESSSYKQKELIYDILNEKLSFVSSIQSEEEVVENVVEKKCSPVKMMEVGKLEKKKFNLELHKQKMKSSLNNGKKINFKSSRKTKPKEIRNTILLSHCEQKRKDGSLSRRNSLKNAINLPKNQKLIACLNKNKASRQSSMEFNANEQTGRRSHAQTSEKKQITFRSSIVRKSKILMMNSSPMHTPRNTTPSKDHSEEEDPSFFKHLHPFHRQSLQQSSFLIKKLQIFPEKFQFSRIHSRFKKSGSGLEEVKSLVVSKQKNNSRKVSSKLIATILANQQKWN